MTNGHASPAPDTPTRGLTPLESELLTEIRGHGKRTIVALDNVRGELGDVRGVLVEIRDRLPAPVVTRPEVAAAAAAAKVTLLTTARAALDGPAGVWLVRSALLVLILGLAGLLGVSSGALEAGPLVDRVLGAAEPASASPVDIVEDQVFGESPATTPTLPSLSPAASAATPGEG